MLIKKRNEFQWVVFLLTFRRVAERMDNEHSRTEDTERIENNFSLIGEKWPRRKLRVIMGLPQQFSKPSNGGRQWTRSRSSGFRNVKGWQQLLKPWIGRNVWVCDYGLILRSLWREHEVKRLWLGSQKGIDSPLQDLWKSLVLLYGQQFG